MESNPLKWVFSIAIRKVLKRAVAPALAYLATPLAVAELQKYGITIDNRMFDEAVLGLLYSIFAFVQNWLKVKTGIPWL